MALVQAYRRSKTYVHQFTDVELVFEPNDKGDVVCDVAPMSAILTAKVEKVPSALEQVTISEPDSPYILRDDEAGTVLDLRPMSDAELHAFAHANGIKVHHNAKCDTIRDKIVEFFQSEV